MVKFMVSRGAAGLFLDPGLGKTICALLAHKILRSHGMIRATLVVAPLRVVYEVWPAEVRKWGLPIRVEILHGPDKAAALRRTADLYLINYEGLPWLVDTLKAQVAKKLLPFNMLVLDESSMVKNRDTVRFKILKRMADCFKRRYLLTGSPAPNGLLDLWSQIYLLDGGLALGKFISHYRAQFFYQCGYQGREWALLPGMETKIYQRLKPLAVRLDARDYQKLPPLIIPPPITVQLPPQVKRAYDELEEHLITDLGGEEITAANAAVATGKLRQFTSGAIYLDGRPEDYGTALAARRWRYLHDAKLEALLELLGELQGQPTIVAYEFNHELARLRRARPGTPYIGGGLKPTDISTTIEAWNHGNIPVLLAQSHSIAHGLNLQGAGRAVVWFSLTWNLEDYEQLIRRVWRQGQKHRVFVYHLVATGTVDVTIMGALRRKAKTQNNLLEALRVRFKQVKARRAEG